MSSLCVTPAEEHVERIRDSVRLLMRYSDDDLTDELKSLRNAQGFAWLLDAMAKLEEPCPSCGARFLLASPNGSWSRCPSCGAV